MKTKGITLLVGAAILVGCNSGDTPIETYQASPNQVTNPNAPPAQAGAPKDSSDAILNNPNMPAQAREALTRGR